MRQPDSSNPGLSPTSLALVRDAEGRLHEVGAVDKRFGREQRFRAACGGHVSVFRRW